MLTVIIYSAQTGKAKSGNTYTFQPLEVVQFPDLPNFQTRHFVEGEALEPGKYSCRVLFRNTPNGCQPRFVDFQKID